MTSVAGRAPTVFGLSLPRVEGVDKVTGRARYAYEYDVDRAGLRVGGPVANRQGPGRRHPGRRCRRSRRRARGALARQRSAAGRCRRCHFACPAKRRSRLPRVSRSRLVVATTPEAAREAAGQLEVEYDVEAHDAVLTPDHPTLYSPGSVNAGYETDSLIGDPRRPPSPRVTSRSTSTYTTPAEHNNPMEPHATTAVWDGDRLRLYDSNQGGQAVRVMVAKAFSIDPGAVDVISAHVGGGFGSKGLPRPNVMLAAMAARVVGGRCGWRLTRQQQFALVGYRTPTIQRLQLGATSDGVLNSITHDVVEQTATLKEFAEQSALITRMMYAAPHRRTTHRLARSMCRSHRGCEHRANVRARLRWSRRWTSWLSRPTSIRSSCGSATNRPCIRSRRHRGRAGCSSQCLRTGAERFGWASRDPRPRQRRQGRWLVGTGVASSTYPVFFAPATARVAYDGERQFTVSINATDIGTGARTALMQVAADALGVAPEQVTILIGDTSLPRAGVAGGSMGMGSWGWAVSKAATDPADPSR